MKLKRFLVSMTLLGFISNPIFATTDQQPALEHLCASPSTCHPDWLKHMQISGESNLDAGKWGNRNGDIQDEQVMSEPLATAAKIGVIMPTGAHGALFAFETPATKSYQAPSHTNYELKLGCTERSNVFGFDLGAGYLYNTIGSQDIAHAIMHFSDSTNNRIGGIALNGDVKNRPFSLGARWTSAVQRFNQNDLPKNAVADESPSIDEILNADASGAKPWAAGIQASHGFEAAGYHRNNVYLGYQASHEAAAIGLPKGHWLVGYGVAMWKRAHFGFEWNHDTDYNTSNGGSGNTSNLVSLRTGIKFS